jgi:hypothetical protein
VSAIAIGASGGARAGQLQASAFQTYDPTQASSTTSCIAGAAVGSDYLISPYTIAGFALAGGGTALPTMQAPDVSTCSGWQNVTTNRTMTLPASISCRRSSTPMPSRATSKAAIAT